MGVEQGQRTSFVADGLIGNAGDSPAQEQVGKLGCGGEVEIGEQSQAAAKIGIFLSDGLLHLHHHIDRFPELGGSAEDLGAGGDVLTVGEGRQLSGRCFDQNLVAGIHQGFGAGRSDPDTGFVIFNFLWNSNDQDRPPFSQKSYTWIPGSSS